MNMFTEIPFSPAESSDGVGLPGIIFQNSLLLEPPVGLPGTGLSEVCVLQAPKLSPEAYKHESQTNVLTLKHVDLIGCLRQFCSDLLVSAKTIGDQHRTSFQQVVVL